MKRQVIYVGIQQRLGPNDIDEWIDVIDVNTGEKKNVTLESVEGQFPSYWCMDGEYIYGIIYLSNRGYALSMIDPTSYVIVCLC